MRFCLLVGLFAGLSSAANLYIWDVDEPCTDDNRADLQRAYDDSAIIAAKTLEDLQRFKAHGRELVCQYCQDPGMGSHCAR